MQSQKIEYMFFEASNLSSQGKYKESISKFEKLIQKLEKGEPQNPFLRISRLMYSLALIEIKKYTDGFKVQKRVLESMRKFQTKHDTDIYIQLGKQMEFFHATKQYEYAKLTANMLLESYVISMSTLDFQRKKMQCFKNQDRISNAWFEYFGRYQSRYEIKEKKDLMHLIKEGLLENEPLCPLEKVKDVYRIDKSGFTWCLVHGPINGDCERPSCKESILRVQDLKSVEITDSVTEFMDSAKFDGFRNDNGFHLKNIRNLLTFLAVECIYLSDYEMASKYLSYCDVTENYLGAFAKGKLLLEWGSKHLSDTGVEYLEHAAFRGVIYSMVELGNIYYQGEVLEKNTIKSYIWFNVASECLKNPSLLYAVPGSMGIEGLEGEIEVFGGKLKMQLNSNELKICQQEVSEILQQIESSKTK
jgi:tetratricopeptide (TPR) repeat protein